LTAVDSIPDPGFYFLGGWPQTHKSENCSKHREVVATCAPQQQVSSGGVKHIDLGARIEATIFSADCRVSTLFDV
jgi:hypothetical protein